MLRVRRGEAYLVIYGLVAPFKAEKRKLNVGDTWFRVSPLSLCLSLSVGAPVCELSPAFFWSGPAVEKFVFYIIFLFWSDQIGFSLFLPRRLRIGRKITFDYFYFLTNFIGISLCAYPMRRNPFFFILKKVSAMVTSGECSHGRYLQSLFCVSDKLERDLFRSYNIVQSFNLSHYFKTHVHIL